VGDANNIYKSLDDGNTWAIVDEQDSTSWPQSGTGTWGYNSIAVDDRDTPTKVYVAYTKGSGAAGSDQHTFYLAEFDFATETWSVEVGGAGPNSVARKTLFSENDTHSGRRRYVLVARTDGLLVLFYTASWNGNGWGVTNYVTHDVGGAGWGTPAALLNSGSRHQFSLSALPVTGDKVHLFYASNTDLFPTTNTQDHLHHVTVNDDYSLNTEQTLTTVCAPDPQTNTGLPAIGSYGSSDYISIATLLSETQATGVSKQQLYLAPLVDDPVWGSGELMPFPVTIDGDHFYFDSEVNANNSWSSSIIFLNEECWVLSMVYKQPSGQSDAGPTYLYLQRRDSSTGWNDAQLIYTEPLLGVTDPDNSYHIGSPAPGVLDADHAGLFFYSQVPSSSVLDILGVRDREYFLVLNAEGEIGNGVTPGICADVTPPGITPTMEWEDEPLEPDT
jgi:hypothetical protein